MPLRAQIRIRIQTASFMPAEQTGSINKYIHSNSLAIYRCYDVYTAHYWQCAHTACAKHPIITCAISRVTRYRISGFIGESNIW